MSWITSAWQFVADEVRDISDAIHGRNGLTVVEAWHAERVAEAGRHAVQREAAGQTRPARETDKRPVAEPERDSQGWPEYDADRVNERGNNPLPDPEAEAS
jgi:hypothetical protein